MLVPYLCGVVAFLVYVFVISDLEDIDIIDEKTRDKAAVHLGTSLAASLIWPLFTIYTIILHLRRARRAYDEETRKKKKANAQFLDSLLKEK